MGRSSEMAIAEANITVIPITKNLVAIIDKEDEEKILPHKWYAFGKENHKNPIFWAARKTRIDGKQKTLLMHREILKPPENAVVDHINGDGLDNRKCNLRIATVSQNRANERSIRNRMGFRGVSLSSKGHKKPFYAKIICNHRTYFLGHYETIEQAAMAYDKKAIELFGDFAVLNFPQQVSISNEINEAKEAIEILNEVQTYLEQNKILAIAEWDFDEQAPKIAKAIKLIQKFSDKHQPAPSRYK